MSAYGLVYDGVHYVSGCDTRSGAYPYCDVMRLPSYSLAKSIFGGVALMAVSQKHDPTLDGALVKDYVTETTQSAGDWTSVTLDNTVDMATGNYRFATYMGDEDSTQGQQ